MTLQSRTVVAAMLAATLAALACGDSTSPPTVTNPPGGTPSTIPPGPYVPGQSYTGRNGYIEYIAGNAPLVYTAPHGGNLLPADIPDRTAARCGGAATTSTDLNTEDLVRAMQQRHFA